MKGKKLDLLALASIPLLMTLGNSMLIPILPLIEREIDISSFQSSLIITVYSVVAIILIPIAGYLSDKIGRKKVIIPSLILTGIGGAIAAVAAFIMDDPYFLILVGRFLQGIGAAGAFPVVIPTVGDMFKDEDDVSAGLGIIETSNTFGKVLSPILGAALALVVWYFPFVFIPILAVIAIALIGFLVKPPKEEQNEKEESFKKFLQLIKDVFRNNGRWLLSTFLIGCINMFILFGFLFHFSTLLEEQYNMDGVWKGFVLAVPLLFLCIASFVAGKKIGENKIVMKWVIFIGNTIVVLSLFFVKEDTTLILISVLLSVAGIGIGMSLPSLDALITQGVEKNIRGTVTSLYSSMRFLGVAAGPPVIAVMLENNGEWIYYMLAALSVIAIIFTFLAIKPDPAES